MCSHYVLSAGKHKEISDVTIDTTAIKQEKNNFVISEELTNYIFHSFLLYNKILFDILTSLGSNTITDQYMYTSLKSEQKRQSSSIEKNGKN